MNTERLSVLPITPGTYVVPDSLPVRNCSEKNPNLLENGPFEVTDLFRDTDDPQRFLVNLRGHKGSFPATAFHKATHEELVKAGVLITIRSDALGNPTCV